MNVTFTPLYLPADQITVGDILPTVSRDRVTGVVTFPNEGVRVTFGGGTYIRHFPYGGPDFGYECLRVERVSA